METSQLQPIETTNQQPLESIPVEINPNLSRVRAGDKSIKFFYSLIRELTERRIPIMDIGSSVEVNSDNKEQIHRLTDEAHRVSKEQEDYITYPSSWGLPEYRQAIANFMQTRSGVEINPLNETMVTGGIIKAVEKTMLALNTTHIIIPSLAPYFVRSLATLHGKQIIETPLNLKSGNLDLLTLQHQLNQEQVEPAKALMYLGIPSSPAGTLPQESFINELIIFAHTHKLFIISDFYSVATTFTDQQIRPLMSYPGAKTVAIEAISLAKELHLAGNRTGGVVGHPGIINAMRLFASSALDMLPSSNQRQAAYALQAIPPETVAHRLRKDLKQDILPRFRNMNWPVITPKAGLDMLVRIPPAFQAANVEDHSLLTSIYLLIEYNLAMAPASIFGAEGDNWIRLVLKQQSGKIPLALDHLTQKGFDWKTEAPTIENINQVRELTEATDLTKL